MCVDSDLRREERHSAYRIIYNMRQDIKLIESIEPGRDRLLPASFSTESIGPALDPLPAARRSVRQNVARCESHLNGQEPVGGMVHGLSLLGGACGEGTEGAVSARGPAEESKDEPIFNCKERRASMCEEAPEPDFVMLIGPEQYRFRGSRLLSLEEARRVFERLEGEAWLRKYIILIVMSRRSQQNETEWDSDEVYLLEWVVYNYASQHNRLVSSFVPAPRDP